MGAVFGFGVIGAAQTMAQSALDPTAPKTGVVAGSGPGITNDAAAKAITDEEHMPNPVESSGLTERGFNPQPDPPGDPTGLAERGFNPQPDPPKDQNLDAQMMGGGIGRLPTPTAGKVIINGEIRPGPVGASAMTGGDNGVGKKAASKAIINQDIRPALGGATANQAMPPSIKVQKPGVIQGVKQ